nr:ParB N-terminal domain-containing protein [Sphingopyxis sp.]
MQDLIDSILAEGGQKVPVVVRHVSGDPDYDYEVIAGTRRHLRSRGCAPTLIRK